VRMLALEQEYLRRHPKRTWQGSGGAPAKTGHPDGEVVGDPIRCVLTKVAEHGGTMHKLELHQAARECGMTREVLATLYNADNQLLRAERSDRVLTADGRDFIARDSGPG
jgi:hypothetical protein